MHCTGCDAYFCMKDFRGHREMLDHQIEGIIGERDALQYNFDAAKQKKVSNSPLLARIDEWQKLTIERVNQTAEQVRQQVNQQINSKQNQMLADFTSFSKELALLRETEDFVETDLARLQQKIKQFELDLKQLNQPTAMALKTENSERIDWNHLIYIEMKSSDSATQSKQLSPAGKPVDIFLRHVCV